MCICMCDDGVRHVYVNMYVHVYVSMWDATRVDDGVLHVVIAVGYVCEGRGCLLRHADADALVQRIGRRLLPGRPMR